jgi:hypothetical protein
MGSGFYVEFQGIELLISSDSLFGAINDLSKRLHRLFSDRLSLFDN